MPLGFDLEFYRNKFNCANYFETGLWDCDYDVSAKIALKCNFKKIFSIEIRDDWIQKGRRVFSKEMESGRFVLIHDDSSTMEKYLLNDASFSEKTMFFLDAHVDNDNIKNYKYKCPLIEEIKAISNLPRKDNIILIDDIRIVKTLHPWGESSYQIDNFLEHIKELILKINPNYKFTLLDGCPDLADILLCYVEE